MRIKLYLKIVSFAEAIRNYFEGKLGEYRVAQAHKYADSFLKKFRAGQPSWAYSAQEKPGPNPFCDHLKGGKDKKKWQVRDYSVVAHSFPDGTKKIWCQQGCGFVSRPGDKNWGLACDMLNSSSNKPSSSERAIIKAQPVGVDGRP